MEASPYKYVITDSPYLAYEIHIAKTSAGWLPLFEAHEGIRSINDLKQLHSTGKFAIYDEYGASYNWEEFDKRVLQHNGGVQGAIKPTPIDKTVLRSSPFYDDGMPDHTPISHFEYNYGLYAPEYFKDSDGYEFTNHEFS